MSVVRTINQYGNIEPGIKMGAIMQLLLDPITVNSRKVLAGFKLIGAEYNINEIDYFQEEHKSSEFLSVNPNATLPALKDEDFTLWESNAILQYASEKVGNVVAYPTEIKARADVKRWLLWESGSWFPSCYKYLVENCVKPLMGGQIDNRVLEEGPNFNKLAGILDDRLSGSQYLCGHKPTIADVV